MMIREDINSLDDTCERAHGHDDAESATDVNIQHISIGSHLGPITLQEVEEIHLGDSTFLNLRKKIINSLTVIYIKETNPWPSKNVYLAPDHQVMSMRIHLNLKASQ